jgi:hypothetical protein
LIDDKHIYVGCQKGRFCTNASFLNNILIKNNLNLNRDYLDRFLNMWENNMAGHNININCIELCAMACKLRTLFSELNGIIAGPKVGDRVLAMRQAPTNARAPHFGHATEPETDTDTEVSLKEYLSRLGVSCSERAWAYLQKQEGIFEYESTPVGDLYIKCEGQTLHIYHFYIHIFNSALAMVFDDGRYNDSFNGIVSAYQRKFNPEMDPRTSNINKRGYNSSSSMASGTAIRTAGSEVLDLRRRMLAESNKGTKVGLYCVDCPNFVSTLGLKGIYRPDNFASRCIMISSHKHSRWTADDLFSFNINHAANFDVTLAKTFTIGFRSRFEARRIYDSVLVQTSTNVIGAPQHLAYCIEAAKVTQVEQFNDMCFASFIKDGIVQTKAFADYFTEKYIGIDLAEVRMLSPHLRTTRDMPETTELYLNLWLLYFTVYINMNGADIPHALNRRPNVGDPWVTVAYDQPIVGAANARALLHTHVANGALLVDVRGWDTTMRSALCDAAMGFPRFHQPAGVAANPLGPYSTFIDLDSRRLNVVPFTDQARRATVQGVYSASNVMAIIRELSNVRRDQTCALRGFYLAAKIISGCLVDFGNILAAGAAAVAPARGLIDASLDNGTTVQSLRVGNVFDTLMSDHRYAVVNVADKADMDLLTSSPATLVHAMALTYGNVMRTCVSTVLTRFNITGTNLHDYSTLEASPALNTYLTNTLFHKYTSRINVNKESIPDVNGLMAIASTISKSIYGFALNPHSVAGHQFSARLSGIHTQGVANSGFGLLYAETVPWHTHPIMLASMAKEMLPEWGFFDETAKINFSAEVTKPRNNAAAPAIWKAASSSAAYVEQNKEIYPCNYISTSMLNINAMVQILNQAGPNALQIGTIALDRNTDGIFGAAVNAVPRAGNYIQVLRSFMPGTIITYSWTNDTVLSVQVTAAQIDAIAANVSRVLFNGGVITESENWGLSTKLINQPIAAHPAADLFSFMSLDDDNVGVETPPIIPPDAPPDTSKVDKIETAGQVHATGEKKTSDFM